MWMMEITQGVKKNVTCVARTYADHSNAIKVIEKTEKYALEGKKKKNATRTIVS